MLWFTTSPCVFFFPFLFSLFFFEHIFVDSSGYKGAGMQPISEPVWKLRRWEEKRAQESLQELFLPHLLQSCCCWWWRGGRPSCQQKQKKLCVDLHSGECVKRRKCVYRAVTGRICGLHSPNCEAAVSCVTTSDHWTVPGLSRLRNQHVLFIYLFIFLIFLFFLTFRELNFFLVTLDCRWLQIE